MTSPATNPGVLALLRDAEEARNVMDHLEDGGIPADSISMKSAPIEGNRSEPEQTDKELDAVGEVGKSVLIWAFVGLIVGALAGLLITLVNSDWSVPTGLLLGGVFGFAIGGAAGGMNVAKYASTERTNTFLAEETGVVAVEVRDPDPHVIDQAATILQDHDPIRLTRL